MRREEFLEQRGLRSEPGELSLEERAADATTDPDTDAALRVEPATSYLQGIRLKNELAAAAPRARTVWRPLGPEGIPRGQTYGSGPGSTTTVAGRVAALAVDPHDSGHVLVGAAAGGIWQTRDGGRSWTPRTDDQPTLAIGALAFDPNTPSVVYAGTGEGNSEYSQLGQGILVSDDGGGTWTTIAQDLFAGFGFYRLLVDPRNGRRLIVATNGGAAESTDGGTTWSLLHAGSTWDVSLAYTGDVPELLLAAPDGLFAVTGEGPARPVALPGVPATLDPRSERMAVTHVAADPGQAFVFLASRGRAHLFHRPAAGRPFVAVRLPSFPVPPYLRDAFDVSQAWYDWYVAVPPDTSDVVYLGAIELLKGERANGRWTWHDISSRLRNGDSIHPDQHAMAIDAQDSRVIYAGNDGGIFRSPDAGGSWESLNSGLAISEVEYLAQRPDDASWILAGLQDNGTVRRDGDGQWSQVALGDGGDCGTDLSDPDVCYHSYYGMSLERSTAKGDPDSWKDVTPPASDQFQALFYPPVEVNGTVVVKAGEVVCVSSDAADTWEQVPLPPDGGRASMASALAVPSDSRVLAGTVHGDVFRIDRVDGHWGQADPMSRPQNGWVSDLLVSAGPPSRCWATYSTPGAVFRSDDDGSTWVDVTAGLPRLPINAVIVDPTDADRVWVACDVGVFESRDAGGSWSVFGSGLPNALAEDLLFHEPDRLLRVATRNRGVWEAAVD